MTADSARRDNEPLNDAERRRLIRPRRTLALIATNVVVFCVCAELLALAVYYVETGSLFYIHRKTYEPIPETTEKKLTGEALHPYFGPTHNPGYLFNIPESLRPPRSSSSFRPVRTNNFGFASPYNFPFVKTGSDQFVIGIFGGSVGVWFCQVGVPRLLDDLRQNDFFAKKELVPLCLSHEGYKQPQQLLLLSYLLSIGQQFDLVINIDGFNDVALSALDDQRGFDISMPSAQHLDPLINLVDQSTLTPDKLQSLAAIDRYKRRLNTLVEAIRRNHIAFVNFVLDRYHRRTLSRYYAELGTFSRLPSNPATSSLIRVTPKLKEREGAMLYQDIATNWATSSILMNELLAARHVHYFHVLQPNQYYTTRTFREGEADVALSNDSPYKTHIELGYPALVREAESGPLKTTVRFFNATHVFDNERMPMYMDNCCHYTLVGNYRLADFIARSILGSHVSWRQAG